MIRRVGDLLVWFAIGAAAILAVQALSGCGGGIVTEHARAARIVAPILHAAHDAIHDGRARELDICESLSVVADREPCLDRGIERWAPVLVTYNLAREGYVAWTDGMSLMLLSQASDTEAGDYLLPLALALVRLYDGIETALEPFEEIDLPDFPGLSVLGGE